MINTNKKGSAWVGIIILLGFILSLGLALMTDSINTIIQSKRSAQIISAQALCDAGIEKSIWELNNNTGYTGTGATPFEMPTGTVDITMIGGLESKIVTVTATTNGGIERTVRATLVAETRETDMAFNYAIQAGAHGIYLANNASLNGNIYSSGPVECQGNENISGDVYISEETADSGVYHRIDNCNVGGNAIAYDIFDSTIAGWGKYVNLNTDSSAVSGFPQITTGELDSEVPFVDMGISPLTIETWESWAEDGGTLASSLTVDKFNPITIGPKKIQGDLIVETGATLTLSGVVWVEGNIKLASGSAINLTPSFGPNSGILIADYPTDRASEGSIKVSSNVSITGSDVENSYSYILMLSQNTKTTAADPAIFAGNNSDSVIYYTNEGLIVVNNNARLKALSGGGIYIAPGAIVDYDIGLTSTNFSGGPGGAWGIKEWQVIH